MNNATDYQSIPVKVFASPKKQRFYDQQDEDKVVDIIRQEILPKAKADYYSVSVKVKRETDGTPKHLIAYMLRKDTYTADVVKINIDKAYKVQDTQDNYDDSMEIGDEDEDETSYLDGDTYASVEFVAATPVPGIPTAKAAVETIHKLALKAGLNSKMLLGTDASLANYKKYLASGVMGFVNVGHGYPGGIVLDDGTLTSSWFSGLSGKPLNPGVIYFNSCQVFNNPLQPAVMNAGARTYIGGIVSLLIGPSEEVCKCFWNRSLFQTDTMKESLSDCEKKHYPSTGAHGISGDMGLFTTGHVVIFQHIDFRGYHRHIFARERNLNHPDDRTMNDKMSSFVVLSGTWKFYRHANYVGPVGGVYPPGIYRWVADVGISNDQVSSLRCIHS